MSCSRCAILRYPSRTRHSFTFMKKQKNPALFGMIYLLFLVCFAFCVSGVVQHTYTITHRIPRAARALLVASPCSSICRVKKIIWRNNARALSPRAQSMLVEFLRVHPYVFRNTIIEILGHFLRPIFGPGIWSPAFCHINPCWDWYEFRPQPAPIQQKRNAIQYEHSYVTCHHTIRTPAQKCLTF